MMALFIVLWLMNTSKQVQEAIGGYFKDPTGNSKMVGSALRGVGQNLDLRKEEMKKIKDALEKQIKSLPDFEKLKKHIEMTITAEGLRIELTEDEKGTFFELGNALPSPSGKELLIALAQEVGKLPNKVSIEGHTDSKPYSGSLSGYSNWELSVDRGNAARRIMESDGLQTDQVSQVRGFSDRQPRLNHSRDDPSNRRISLIVEYTGKESPKDGADEAGNKAEAGKSSEGKPESANTEKR
jgi:chemotaxis protein MotB